MIPRRTNMIGLAGFFLLLGSSGGVIYGVETGAPLALVTCLAWGAITGGAICVADEVLS